MDQLAKGLSEVDEKVRKLKKKLEKTHTEAAKLELALEKSKETLEAAENLVGKLEGEYKRWSGQVGELSKELTTLPLRSLLAAGFMSYMSNAAEDVRHMCLNNWMEEIGVEQFEMRRFLSTESEQLVWKGQGLPSDPLSMENAIVILQVGSMYFETQCAVYLLSCV